LTDKKRELEQEHQRWKDSTLKKTLDRFPERREEFSTLSIDITKGNIEEVVLNEEE